MRKSIYQKVISITLAVLMVIVLLPISGVEVLADEASFQTEPMIAAGELHTVILKYDGTVWSFGWNEYGQLGDRTTKDRSTPVKVKEITDATSIAVGATHTAVLKSDGTVWTFGNNEYGQLGDGTQTSQSTPVQVQELTEVIAIAAGGSHTVALKSDGTVWAFGFNGVGQLGDGTATHRSTPVQVKELTGVTAIASGYSHTVALKNDGTVWTFGRNLYGQLGDDTTQDKSTPVQVKELTEVTSIDAGNFHTVALKNDGTVWTFGYNMDGELGDGTRIDKSTPVEVQDLTEAIAIAAGGYHTAVLKNNETVWTFGYNVYGELGYETTAYYTNNPAQVQELTEIAAIDAGGNHTIALKSDGTVWSFGRNDHGQLGDGTTSGTCTPVQVLGKNGNGYLNLFESSDDENDLYYITYELNGGTNNSQNPEYYYENDNTIELADPSRTGYTFDGWYEEAKFVNQVTSIQPERAENITLYAKWSPNSYTITFDANGGSTSTSTKSVNYDSTYGTLPNPSRTGYSFKGWYTAKSGGNKITAESQVSITNNQTIYAQWEEIAAKNVSVSSIKLNATSKTLNIKKTFTLKPNVSPSSATNKNVTYSSSNSSVAAVSSKGVITAKKAGKAVITATTKDGSKKKAQCTIYVKPAKPTSVKTKKKTTTSAKITWKKVANATGYEVYRSTKKNSGFKKIKTLKGVKKVSFTNKKLKNNKTYYYKVRAYKTINNKKVYSAYSAVKKIKMK